MTKFDNPLNNIKIASPCSADWNAMMGDGRKRYCGDCKLNVYNLSGMTRAEAENLIVNSEGRVCVRFYRRADGTVLTKDCPVGWQMIKQRVSKTVTAFASFVFTILSAVGLANYFTRLSDEQTTGMKMPKVGKLTTHKYDSNSNSQIREQPVFTMGNVSVTNKREYTLSRGSVSNFAEVGQMIKTKPKR